MKIDRKKIHAMFSGHCAYCGEILPDESGKYMQVDHVEAVYRNIWNKGKMIRPENDNEENLLPACKRCNNYKDTMSIEIFRKEIFKAIERLEKIVSYRNAIRFGMIEIKEWDGLFYFEKFN